jgi:hypothetical protein
MEIFIPLEIRLFRGTENATNSFPSHSAKDKKAWNSVLNHLVEEKKTINLVILFRTIPWQIKLLEFGPELFCRREKHSEFCSKPLSKRKFF